MIMVLQDYKIEGDYIKVSKKELEELSHHYYSLVAQYDKVYDPFYRAFYAGKESAILDILKMFESLEG